MACIMVPLLVMFRSLKVAVIGKGFDEHLQAALSAAGNGNKE